MNNQTKPESPNNLYGATYDVPEVPLKSSFLVSCRYDELNSILQLDFLSGESWLYYQLPVLVYQQFINAQSHGHFFRESIRDYYPQDQGELPENDTIQNSPDDVMSVDQTDLFG